MRKMHYQSVWMGYFDDFNFRLFRTQGFRWFLRGFYQYFTARVLKIYFDLCAWFWAYFHTVPWDRWLGWINVPDTRFVSLCQGWCDIYGVQYTARNTARCSTIFWVVYCKIKRGQFKVREISILTFLILHKSRKISIFYSVFPSVSPISIQKDYF